MRVDPNKIRDLEERAFELKRDNIALRKLLAFQYAGAELYTDDGELQDGRMVPHIDFLRDAPAEIEQKMKRRGVAFYDAVMRRFPHEE